MREATEKKNLYRVIEAVVLVAVLILFSCFFDYRYAMNDDVLIGAIVSGNYSGVPDMHNIQLMLPLNVFFTLLYRITGTVPWFGLFLVFSQFYSLYTILNCLLGKAKPTEKRDWVLLVATNLLFVGIMLYELIIVQYSYTAALLVTSATIRLYCEDSDFFSKKGVLCYLGILGQYIVAFCLRTEIFLFLLPFSLLLTVIRYYRENGFRLVSRKLGQWGIIWGSLLACVLMLYGIEYVGYSDAGWSEYRKVFEYRTQLYDFLTLPDYAENKGFYDSTGISEAQYILLDNYNFSLDDDITSDTLRSVVEYADEKRISEHKGLERLYYRMFTLPLKEGIWSYCHRVLFDPIVAGDDYPWNFVCAALYAVLLLLTCFSGRIQNIVYMFLMFSVRSVLWMYIILKQRTPNRVTHSLFVIEIVCLLVLVFEELSWLKENGKPKRLNPLYAGISVLFLAGAVTVAFTSWGSFRTEYQNTVAFNEEWEELLAYYRERKDNFYFMDVYSTVNYSEAIFTDNGEGTENYDICGGWLAKSPLCGEKYAQFGFTSIQEALLEKDNVYFVAEQGADLEWLSELYAEKGVCVDLECQDSVAGQFDVYKINVR